MRIVIDPGHGGSTQVGKSTPFGYHGPSGMVEKDVNLELARRVAQRLGSAAVLSRTNDVNLSLAERLRIGRSAGAEALVSIHSSAGAGASNVWVHDRADGRSAALAQAVAGSMGRVGPVGGVRGADLALLAPESLAGMAGCMIDADCLGHGPLDAHQLDRVAGSIAEGLSAYNIGNASQYAEPFFKKDPPKKTPVKEGPSQNPSNYKMLAAGILKDGSMTFSGGQGMWFTFENHNILGASFTITSSDGQYAQVVLPPMGKQDYVFTSFGNEPMHWSFTVRFNSQGSPVTMTLKSTWVEGDPPNR